MQSQNSVVNWEMPVREVPSCKWYCSNPDNLSDSCWNLCRNNKNLVKQIIEVNEHKKTDH